MFLRDIQVKIGMVGNYGRGVWGHEPTGFKNYFWLSEIDSDAIPWSLTSITGLPGSPMLKALRETYYI